MSNSVRFQTTSDFDRESPKRLKMSKIGHDRTTT